MTHHHQDPTDLTRRRRVSRIRAELGLTPVPTYLGTEMQSITDAVSARVHARMGSDLPRYALPPPEEQRRLFAIASRTVEEFASIVEERPLVAPTVGAMLLSLSHEAEHPERWPMVLHATLQILRQVVRDSWAQLDQADPYVELLDAALTQYTDRLCIGALNLLQPADNGSRRVEEARVANLLARVERRFSGKSIELCLGISAPTPDDHPSTRTARASAAAAAARARAAAGRNDALRPLRLVASDHVLVIAQHPATKVRTARAAQSPVALWVGPVRPGDIALAYDIALLQFRLIVAGVAAPPPPVVLRLPDLGFLHPCPTEANVEKIAGLLQPLARQRSIHRRVTLAQTLRLRLRTTSTAQSLARQLGVHTQTVHTHLVALRECYDNNDLDFGHDTLAIQASLDLILPLWELEKAGRAGKHPQPESPPTDEQRTHQKPPSGPEDLA